MSNQPQSLASAARARSVEITIGERLILKPSQGSDILDNLAAKRKPQVQTTPLHVNIPVDLDRALKLAMQDLGLEKTAIVRAALLPVLKAYLGK
jgi:hypothetical protein